MEVLVGDQVEVIECGCESPLHTGMQGKIVKIDEPLPCGEEMKNIYIIMSAETEYCRARTVRRI
ncbi:MAG: hypothetical protein A2142_03280 [candidate division Zixibacteria bacterium RBG_16_48_11]|nr:MAG: hypothetical protein A2142_03280 [candidate division Zixibacteria bacterium RBG_16_48_11]